MLRFLVLFVALLALVAACGVVDPEPEPGSSELAAASSARPSPLRYPVEATTTTLPPPTTTTVAPPPPSTTTTMPPSPPPPPARVATGGQVNGYPCGGDLPPCWVLQRESGGNPTAVNPDGCGGYSCGGLWQFDPRTWDGYGGFAYAQDAPADVQNAKARQLWAGGAGCSHWAAC